jgi:hypothetical protein
VLCEGNREGGLLIGDPEGRVKEGAGKRHPSPLGNLEGGGAHLSRTLKDGRRRSLKTDRLYVSSARAPLLETLKETQRKVLEIGIDSVTVLLYIRT